MNLCRSDLAANDILRSVTLHLYGRFEAITTPTVSRLMDAPWPASARAAAAPANLSKRPNQIYDPLRAEVQEESDNRRVLVPGLRSTASFVVSISHTGLIQRAARYSFRLVPRQRICQKTKLLSRSEGGRRDNGEPPSDIHPSGRTQKLGLCKYRSGSFMILRRRSSNGCAGGGRAACYYLTGGAAATNAGSGARRPRHIRVELKEPRLKADPSRRADD
ncbi:hypothetical protein EVAR_20605_1 [Eumeta japonica]|uniref:Uncharacterized protein n=1 Tax=Eumeta variegata TaxID=151549 RepID=A0A4C1UTC0_EUMVA|nr:hypothetical protein EVAR_20605_1 [Eumeta japonica]